MAGDIYAFHDQPLESVQALLLLCWWPYTHGATRDEPVLVYSGLATNVALQHGLHRSHHHSDWVHAGELDETLVKAFQRAWTGCNIVNQMTNSYYGTPATVHPRWSPTMSLPSALEHYLRIASHQYHICQALGDCDESSSGLLSNPKTTISALESHLTSFEFQLGTLAHPCVEMYLLQTKLCLYSFIVSAGPNKLSAGDAAFLIQASDTAVKIIHLASTSQTQKHWPTIVRISTVFAVNMLLLLSTVPGHDQQSASRNSISEAWRLLQSKSEFEHDSWSRMAKIVAYLSRVYAVSKNSDASIRPALLVRSRMAANVLFGNACHAKQRFSGDVRDRKPLDYTAAAALEDLGILDFSDPSFDPAVFNDFTTPEISNWFVDL